MCMHVDYSRPVDPHPVKPEETQDFRQSVDL